MSHRLISLKNIFQIFLLLLLLIGVLMIFGKQNEYNVILKEHGNHGLEVKEKDKIDFVDAILKGYRETLNKEINYKFQDKFKLSKNYSAKFIVSSYDESIVYIYPSDKKEIFIDYVNRPAQMLFFYGLIDLTKPLSESEVSKIKINPNMSHGQLKEMYASAKTQVTVQGSIDGIDEDESKSPPAIFPDIIFSNHYAKIFNFVGRDSFMTIGSDNVVINLNAEDPIARGLYRKQPAKKITYSLKGPLIFSNVTDFSRSKALAEKIGIMVLEQEIPDLITKSNGFKYFMAHKKLKPVAEEIVLKKKRSEDDPSFNYPLWMFKEDLANLKELAVKENISEDYIYDLILDLKTSTKTGTLIFYYQNEKEFTLQWIFINVSFLFLVTLFAVLKSNDVALIQILLNWFSAINAEKYVLVVIVIAINGWVFSNKPTHLDIRYWIFPSVFFIINLTVIGYIYRYLATNKL